MNIIVIICTLLIYQAYSSVIWENKDLLTVHLVPHSHDDAGWVRTIDEYYYESVKEIYDNVLECLVENPSRKFIIVEQIFFSRWFTQASTDDQNNFRNVLQRGQVEFVAGGWCMNDEATVLSSSMIDQLNHGQQFLQRTFGIHPRYGYQIDPFGHSAATAKIFPRMKYEAVILNRIHYKDKQLREKEKRMEFIWKGVGDQEDGIVAHIMDRHYSSPPEFDFDNDRPIGDEDRLKQLSEWLVAHLKERSKSYPSKQNFLQLIGDDFRWKNARAQYTNWEKVIKFVNQRSNKYGIILRFSTLRDYFEARQLEVDYSELSTFVGDFFPYADNEESYWTGYFTSKPAFKRRVRQMEHIKRTAEITSVRRFLLNPYETNCDLIEHDLRFIRGYVAEVQHHDAITGTSKEYVTQSYVNDLSKAETVSNSLISHNLQILSHSKEQLSSDFSVLLDLTEGRQIDLVLFNPNSETQHMVEIPCFHTNVSVYDSDGDVQIMSQILPVGDQLKQNYPFTLVFKVDQLLPFETRRIVLRYDPESKSKSTVLLLNHNFDTFEMRNLVFSSSKTTDVLIKLRQSDGSFLDFNPQLMEYQSYTGPGQPSGAYIFRTTGHPTPLKENNPQMKYFELIRGGLIDEFRIVSQDYTQTFRVYKVSEGFYGKTIEIQTLLGTVAVDSEVVLRFDLGKEGCSLVSDDGGEILMERREISENIAANFNPATITGGLRCRNDLQALFLLDRPMAVGSLKTGQIEFMLQRRTSRDDWRGVEEPLNDVSIISTRLNFFVGTMNSELLHRYFHVKQNHLDVLLGRLRDKSSPGAQVAINKLSNFEFIVDSTQIWECERGIRVYVRVRFLQSERLLHTYLQSLTPLKLQSLTETFLNGQALKSRVPIFLHQVNQQSFVKQSPDLRAFMAVFT